MFGHCKKRSAAHVVGGGLVISLTTGADHPGVWRFDMDNLKSACFDLEEDKGAFALSVRDGTGARTRISVFKDKAAAEAVLADIHFALLHGGGTGCPHKGKWRRRLFWSFIAVVLILAFLFFPVGSSSVNVTPPGKTGSVPTAPRMGAPQSADDFFNKR